MSLEIITPVYNCQLWILEKLTHPTVYANIWKGVENPELYCTFQKFN